MKSMFGIPAAAVLCLVLAPPPSALHAADLYRWVDEAGKTHYGDTVPRRYRDKATRVAPAAPPPTADQQRAAAVRAAREREAQKTATPPRTDAKGAPRALPEPEPVARGISPCEAAKQRFLESQQCFDRFRLVNGGLKAEAFEHCEELKPPACE